MASTEEKQALIATYHKHDNDTGSAHVQIALLTKHIQELTGHLKEHPKDFHSRRGLLQMVGKRRRFLNYLKKRDLKTFKKIAEDLEIRVK